MNDLNEYIAELKNGHPDKTWHEICDILYQVEGVNLSTNAAQKRYARYTQNNRGIRAVIDNEPDPKDREEWKKVSLDTSQTKQLLESAVDTLEFNSVGDPRIKTIEDFVRVHEVDLNVWDISRTDQSNWEQSARSETTGEMEITTLYKVGVTLKRRVDTFLEEKILDAIEKMRTIAPVKKSSYKPDGDHLLIPCLFDVHIGKPQKDIANLYASTLNDVVEKALRNGYDFDQIIFPVGNDFLNFDNLERTTTAGTQVSSDLSMYSVIDTACEIILNAVNLLSNYAPTHVMMVAGNHDRLSTYWLGKMIEAYFDGYDEVTVDSSKDHRKYYLWNNVLMGFCHGDGQKRNDLPLLMATEQPTLWGKSDYREWLTGHLHGRSTVYHSINEKNGVISRIIPALCDSDDWHIMKGFVGNRRAAEAYIWSKKGFEDQLNINI